MADSRTAINHNDDEAVIERQPLATSRRGNSHVPATDTCIVCWEIDPPDGGLWDDDGFVCHRCDLGAFVDVGELVNR